jgi:hypothetical protein
MLYSNKNIPISITGHSYVAGVALIIHSMAETKITAILATTLLVSLALFGLIEGLVWAFQTSSLESPEPPSVPDAPDRPDSPETPDRPRRPDAPERPSPPSPPNAPDFEHQSLPEDMPHRNILERNGWGRREVYVALIESPYDDAQWWLRLNQIGEKRSDVIEEWVEENRDKFSGS